LATAKLDDRPIVVSQHATDAVDVANGTLRGERRRYLELEASPAIAGSARRTRTRPSRLRVGTTLIADELAILAASLLAVWVAGAFDNVPLISRLIVPFAADPHGGTLLFILLTPFWLAALWAFGLYREPGRSIGGLNLSESLSGLTALTAASWLLLIALVFVSGASAPVATLIAFWMLAIVFVPAARWLSRVTVWSRTSFQERVLIIGAGEVGHTLAAKIGKHAEYRMKLVGFLDDGEPRRNGNGHVHVPVIGALDDLHRIVTEEHVDRVIVAFSKARHNDFLRVVRACDDSGVRVNIVPRLFEVVSSRAVVDDVEGIPLLDVAHVELNRFNVAVKRVFDLLVGGLIFLLVLPILGLVALAIKIDSRGPVFFRQERMGRGGRPFRIFKFRSMHDGADKLRLDLAGENDYDGPMFKMHDDPRMTRLGGWLRRWSVDELPQIINVMSGDMSLVGPRPLWVEEAQQCRGWTQKRLDITPGITGLWQVLGRSDIPFDEMVKLDYMYVTGWSLSWDIKLLLQTAPAVLQKRGAY
jgi:exopolysaccharide biosynthesis polyprenyl glycosylphosphotransferase